MNMPRPRKVKKIVQAALNRNLETKTSCHTRDVIYLDISDFVARVFCQMEERMPDSGHASHARLQ
jgi:hypothetical protein